MYFVYFLRITRWKKLISDLKVARIKSDRKYLFLVSDMVLSSFKFNTSFHEYFYYSFYLKDNTTRSAYASMGYMYEYQLRNNPPNYRNLLEDKIVFLKRYNKYIGRAWLDLRIATSEQLDEMLASNKKLVLKNSLGGAGKNIKIISTENINLEELRAIASQGNYDLLEEFVTQHPELNKLSPHSLNTIRIITQINRDGTVDIIGTIIRLGVEHETDNLSTGGIACPVDPILGCICGPGISFDIQRPEIHNHPYSGKELMGFKVPFWSEALEMCKDAARLHPENKSIGWDVGITEKGPLLIEGNHDWGARLWQMPVNKGLKHLLEIYR